MRYGKLFGLGGLAFGVAMGIGSVATADPDTDSSSPMDTWLYGNTPGLFNTLPGGHDYYGEAPDTYYHGDTPWYTVDETGFGDWTQSTVTKILDPEFGYPSVGTVADQTVVNIPVDLYSLPPTYYLMYADYRISDPDVGTGDYTTYFQGAFTNFYVSDAAGIEDQVTFGGGPPITVFDFPASDAGSSEAGDGSEQLMSELLAGAAGSAAVPDLF